MDKIHCTIGMLTYNSEANVARALASVQEFAEIVIADGSSADHTVEIARAAGARVIPQSDPGHPIADFAKERNRTLEAATEPWFFYLDSDEIMTPELRDKIRAVTLETAFSHAAYRVRYLKTDAGGEKRYRTYREYYQIRLVRTDINAHFERSVHERIVVPAGTAVGRLEEPWLVPLDEGDLELRKFSRKAWKRIGIQAASWHPRSVGGVFKAVLGEPVTLISKSLVKMIAVKLRYGREAIPMRYEALRILYALMLLVRYGARLFRL